jgi:hypothetical protein
MYWPRIYFMEENSDSKSISANERSEDGFQDDYEEYGFDATRVIIGQKYKSRTAALPHQNSGFQ